MGLPIVKGLNLRKALVTLQPRFEPILFSGQVQPAYICLPSVKLAAGLGLAPRQAA